MSFLSTMKEQINRGGISGIVTVRNSLLAVVTLLTLLVFFMSGSSAINALKAGRDADKFVAVNELSKQLIELVESVSNERAISRMVLASSQPIDSDVKPQLEATRIQTDALLPKINKALAAIDDIEGKDKIVAVYTEALGKYRSARSNLDKAADLPADARSGAENVADNLAAMVDAAQYLRQEFENETVSPDSRLATNRQLMSYLSVMIVQSSEEWGGLGSAIASGEAIPFQLSIQLPVTNGRALGAWEQAKKILESERVSADLSQHVEKVVKAYVENFSYLKDEIYVASEDGDDYPYSQAKWIEASKLAIDSMVGLSQSIIQDMDEVAEENASSAAKSLTFDIIMLLVVFAVAGISYWWVIKKIVSPINVLSDVMTKLSQGDNDVEIRGAERHDEIGAMAQCVQVFRDNAIEKIRLDEEIKRAEEERHAQEAADAEARRQAEKEQREREEEQNRLAAEQRREEMLKLANDFEASVMGVVSSVAESSGGMEAAAQEMSQIAEDTSSKSAFVASASEQASKGMETVAAATEELSASIREISSQMNTASNSSRQAVDETVSAAEDIKGLDRLADQVGNIVNQISEIAEQTNLLALNATIEAARAGEAGRGFAVVASEVKALATQTATATDDISRQIQEMQLATKGAVDAITRIQAQISEIGNNAVTMAASVEEQDASTQEIARNVAEVSAGTMEVTSNISAVNEGAVTTGSAATEVLSSAQALSQQSDTLRREVENFLNMIRNQ